ncbi:MAG: feruloyl-CoA synthase [Hyalangium sp.]|uniref:feruloyl-CoA synthase n=1 Tax=Hyalangium sp. TaxID=2028555 RepID=UPI0038999739
MQPLRLAPRDVELDRRGDGSLVLRSRQPLGPHARAVGEWLIHWAAKTPDRLFLAERVNNEWRTSSYAQTLDAVRRIGQSLLDRGLGPERPVAILSDNSIDHALLALGAMHVGVPVAPISPAYSLMSSDFAKLRAVFELLRPGLVWTADPKRFAPALAAVGASVTAIGELTAAPANPQVDEAFARLMPDTVAKILFTSGSTGTPKGVITTHRMLTANQTQIVQAWPFMEDEPPVLVDWLPWNHTFGGNFTFGLVLRNGGTMYIDGGKPVPGLIDTTVRNLREIAPNLYFNVPRGFDLLLSFLERDAELRRNFFSRCKFVFYAAAALSQNLWDRFEKLARAERDGNVLLVSAWGSTETAPLATAVHWPIQKAGCIGLPVPGCELKLVPTAGKLEARVRGPNVMPGYLHRADLTAAAFDEEGFYRIGDALKFEDPSDPARGVAFDGRVAEDFKLSNGTWVHVGALRVALIAAADPLVQDAVITGHDRDEVGALLFLNPVAASGLPAEEIRSRIREALRRLAAGGGGSSTRIGRALVLEEAPRLDLGEITDKGYLNQQAVLESRRPFVDALYAETPAAVVIRVTS